MLRFKCKKCKHSFSFEESPQFYDLSKVIPSSAADENTEEILEKCLKDITSQMKCMKCSASVYLIGIGDKTFDSEIDFTSAPIVIAIKDAIDLVTKGKYDEYRDCVKRIIWLLLDNPGQLVYIEDPDLMQAAGNALKIIWENVDTSDLFDEMVMSGNMVSIISDYTDRAQQLKPTLVSVKPDEQTSVYFQDAINSWLFGLNNASLILCCSVIENLLIQKLWNIDMNLVKKMNPKDMKWKDRELWVLIKNATDHNILGRDENSKAHNVRDLRCKAVHKLKIINSAEAYKAIMDTKQIIEKILKTP